MEPSGGKLRTGLVAADLVHLRATAGSRSRTAREQVARDVLLCQAVACHGITGEPTNIGRSLQDRWVFVPIWLESSSAAGP